MTSAPAISVRRWFGRGLVSEFCGNVASIASDLASTCFLKDSASCTANSHFVFHAANSDSNLAALSSADFRSSATTPGEGSGLEFAAMALLSASCIEASCCFNLSFSASTVFSLSFSASTVFSGGGGGSGGGMGGPLKGSAIRCLQNWHNGSPV